MSGGVDAVRSVHLTPDKPVLNVGDELVCSARGNPTPQLTFSPATAGGSSGEDGAKAWKTMIVSAEWKNQTHRVNCTAVNELDGTHQVTASATFKVVGQ